LIEAGIDRLYHLPAHVLDMKPYRLYFLASLLCLSNGCGMGQRVKLEKEDQELKVEASKNRAVADYDLQAKCCEGCESDDGLSHPQSTSGG
jgi:hypothetical protein